MENFHRRKQMVGGLSDKSKDQDEAGKYYGGGR